MTVVTLCFAIIAVLAALLTTPSRALAVYCTALVLYPPALTLQIASADFSVSRICILAVLANAVIRFGRHRSFRWTWMDVFILATWGLGFIALLQTFPRVAVERHAGVMFDTILPYLAARLVVTSQEELVTLIKTLAVVAVPIALLALVQTFSGVNPVGFLSEYYGFGMQGQRGEHDDIRLGLYRAAVMFPHAIALGLFFVMTGALTLSFWKYRVWSRPVVLAMLTVAAAGLFASLSSGPLLAFAGAAAVFLVYADWRLAAALAALSVVSVVGLAAYSGEPYLDVLTDFSFNPWTGQLRFELYREALGGGMSGHWWTGYGYVGAGPGTDNTHFHWTNVDIISIYLEILVRTGLLGLLPFLLANVFYYARLVRAIRCAKVPEAGWLAWCLLAGLLGWNVGMMTAAPSRVILQLLYVFMAIATNMPAIVTARAPRAS